MVPRENQNNAYAKFGETSKEYYGIFGGSLYMFYCYACQIVLLNSKMSPIFPIIGRIGDIRQWREYIFFRADEK